MIRLPVAGLVLVLWCQGQTIASTPLNCGSTNNTSASSNYGGSGGNAAPASVSKLPIRSLLYSGSQTRIFTRYMPWFGDRHHRDVGYRSDDEQQVARQVQDMISRGIQGAIVDWYGLNSGSKSESTNLLMKEAQPMVSAPYLCRDFDLRVCSSASLTSSFHKEPGFQY